MTVKVDLESPLLTIRDVAAYLNVHCDYVRDLCDKGILQTINVGLNHRRRMIRIPMNSLQEYLDFVNSTGGVL